jgi:hypothetical protein
MKARKTALIVALLSFPLFSGIARIWRESVERRALVLAQKMAHFKYLQGRAEGRAEGTRYANGGDDDARSTPTGE